MILAGAYIYWNVAGGLRRLSLALDAGSVEEVAAGDVTPVAILVEPPYVYWLNYDPYVFERISLDSLASDAGPQEPTVLLSSYDNFGDNLVPVRDRFYWATVTSGGVWTIPATIRDGGAPQQIASEAHAWTLWVDGTYVYWTASTGDDYRHMFVRAAPLDGSIPAKRITQFGTGSNVIADDQRVYWVADDGVHARPLLSIKKADLFGHD